MKLYKNINKRTFFFYMQKKWIRALRIDEKETGVL
jgi:hypothetical protein